MKMIQGVKCDFFQTQLQTRTDITIAFCQRGAESSRRTKALFIGVRKDVADPGRSAVPTHLDALSRMQKIIQIQPEFSNGFCRYYLSKFINEARLAVGRKAHDLSFIAVV